MNNSSRYSALQENSSDEVHLPSIVSFIAKRHILLLHAGGDSKRVPWANPMGKAFLPLPYLATDEPDGPVPLLFDHILATASCSRQAFKNEGIFFPFLLLIIENLRYIWHKTLRSKWSFCTLKFLMRVGPLIVYYINMLMICWSLVNLLHRWMGSAWVLDLGFS